MDLAFTAAALPMLITAAAIISLGIYVLGRERANAMTISLLVLTAALWTWLTPIGLMTAARDEHTALVLARIAYIGVALIPAAVLQLTMALLDKRNRSVLMAAWAFGGVFVFLFTSTNFLLAGTYHYGWGYYPHLQDASALFLAYFALLLATALFLLGKSSTHSEQERRRNVAFMFALSIGYLGSIDYLPAFGVNVYPIGCLAILGFIGMLAHMLFRLRLSDLSPSFVADHLLQTMQGGVIVVDMRGRVQVVNGVAANLLGCEPANLRDTDLLHFLGVQTLPATDNDSFARNLMSRDRLVRWRRADSSEVELNLSASAVRDDTGNALGVLYVLSDVSATHDMLTAVPNRVRFSALFEPAKKRILDTSRVPAILFIDLDGFKAVNDEHGHAAGDMILQLAARRIRRAIRGVDLLARYGGDEFIALVDLARQEDGNFVAMKLQRVISEPYAIEEKLVTIGASIGIAFYPTDGETLDDLLRAADRGMYNEKRAGKQRLQIVRDDKQAPPPFGVMGSEL